jgi:hypothetical protein
MPQSRKAQMEMAAMRWVERPPQQPDAAVPLWTRSLTRPTLQVGSPLSRIAGEGVERGEAGEGQGRT